MRKLSALFVLLLAAVAGNAQTYCTPNYLNTCSSGTPMYASFASFVGEAGSSIIDPSSTCSEEYINNTAMSVTLYRGTTYTPSLNITTTYYANYSFQIWIDYNDDGTFAAGESVGGLATIPSSTTSVSINIPAGVTTGTHRMRLVGNYKSCCGGVTYPSIPPCVTTSINYGQARDYTVLITDPVPCTTPAAQPTALSFTSSLTSITGSFTASASANSYLVVMTNTSTPPTAPTDGQTYTVGSTALGGTIVHASGATSFTATGLTDNTTYYFWVYAMNAGCIGTPPLYLATTPLSGSTATQICSFSGPKTIGPGGDYATIASAVTAINTLGLGTNASLEILPSYTSETFPINITELTCASADRRLIIRPHSSNGSTKSITSSVTNALISMNGARYVTIDGRINSTGSTSRLTITNSYSSTSSSASTLQFINGASDNIVRYVTLQGSGRSTASGIVKFTTSTAATGNNNNKLEYCDITANGSSYPYNAIYAAGTTGKENSFDTISNCNISNYFYASGSTHGIYIASGNTDWNISSNRLFQTASRTYTASVAHYGIRVASTNGNNFRVIDNVIGSLNSSGTGICSLIVSSTSYSTTFRAISMQVGNITPSSVQGNTVTNLVIYGGSSSTILYGIEMLAGSVNVGTETGNIIGSATTSGALTRVASSNGTVGIYGIYSAASTPAVLNISNNQIGGITLRGTSTSYGCGMYGIYASSNGSTTISNNTIGSNTMSGSINSVSISSGYQRVYGIYSSISSSSTSPVMITDNVVANITTTGYSTSSGNIQVGIYHTGTAQAQILRNHVHDINSNSAYSSTTSTWALRGISYNGSTGSAVIHQNTVNALTLTYTSSSTRGVAGIYLTSSLNGNISGNRIYDLRNASPYTSTTSPPLAVGIFCYSPSTSVNIYNNMVSLGLGASSSNAYVGIMAGLNGTYTLRAYHNSIYIGGAVSSGSIPSACFHRGNYSGGTFSSTTVDIKNNIFYNARTGGGNNHFAIANNINGSGSSSGWPGGASNYNILNSANASTLGYWSGNRTFASWKTAVSPNQDLNSFSATAVTFTNTTTGDLHINMGTTSNDIESHGNTLSGYTTDYDGDTRPGPSGSVNGGGGAADIGADEFDGVANDNIPPAITYTPNGCHTNTDYVFTAQISDPGGVATGTLAPRVYFRKGAASYTSSQGTLVSGTTLNGVWSFTVSASAMGGLTTGNSVSYYVIAQDAAGYVGSNTNTSLIASNVNTVTTHPTNPATFSVGIGGTYTVGSGGNYTTLTSAVAAYNAYCLTGPVVFSLISPTYPSESYPIQINNNIWASSTNTLTIQPAAGVNASISASVSSYAPIRLYGAKHVIIDGLKSGGSSLSITNTYTSTSAVVLLSSLGTNNGCRNVTLKNLNLTGGSNTSSGVYGICATSTTTASTNSSYDHDTITIEGNTIQRVYYGISAYSATTASTGYNDWVIQNNIIGPSAYNTTTNVGYRGMYLSNMQNTTVKGNTVNNVGINTTSLQSVGIHFNTGMNGYTIDSNYIKGIAASYGSSSAAAGICGIYIGSSCINGKIRGNTINNVANYYTSSLGGARGILLYTGTGSSNIEISNNMISDIRQYGTYTSTTGFPSGIVLASSNGLVKIYHNTVMLDGTTGGNASTGSACLAVLSAAGPIDVRNNIFINKYNNAASASDKGYAFYTTVSNSYFSNLDYNNYYVQSPCVLAYTSGDRSTLSAFQAAYGGNANSVNIAAECTSSSDLHLTTASVNSSLQMGTPLAEVTKDIDGETRNTTTPTVGADEIATCTVTAGTVNPAVASFCASGTTTVTATGASSDGEMQWRSSTDSVNWTTIASATNDSYVISPAITTTTWYRFVNKCASSSEADSAVTKVVINPLPAVITGQQVLCVGGTSALSTVTSGGTWSTSNASVATVGTAGTVSALSTGTATISYTLSTGCVRTAVVTVNALPTVASVSASDNGFCVGTAVTFTAGSVTGTGSVQSYNWTGPNSFSTTTAGNSTGLTTSTTAQSGNYSVTVTYPGAGCTSAMAVTSPAVTVNALPVVASVSSSTNNLCIGAGVTLTAGAASGTGSLTSYNWTGPNGFSTTTAADNTNFTTTTTAQSGNYSVTVTYPGTGCTSSAAVTSPAVTVNAVPTVADITPSATELCIGSAVTFTAGAVTGSGTLTSYNWSGPNSFSTTTSANTTGFTTSTTAESGAYTVSVTYPGDGCTSAAVATSPAVTVNAVPTVASITPSSTNLCVGTALNFTAGAVTGAGTLTSYNWMGPNAFSTTTSGNTTGFTTAAAAESGAYSVSVTYSGVGCTSAMVQTSPTVTVNALPTVASVAASTSNLCVGTGITFTAGAVNGTGALTSYNWTGPNAFSTTTAANTTGFTTSTTAESGAYSVSVTYPGDGCTSTMAVTSPAVTVNALPTVASITPSQTELCTGNSVTFTAGAVTGAGTLASYNWSGPDSFSTTTGSNSTILTTSTTAESGVYSLSVTYPGDGCTSSTVVTSPAVTVNPAPTVASITASSSNLCVGTGITFTAGATTGTGTLTSYNWTGPNSFSTTTATNTVGFTTSTPAESGAYSVSVTYAGSGCNSPVVATSPAVTVNALPTVASVTPSETDMCVGAAVTFTAGAVTGTGTLTSYNWSGPNAFSTTTGTNTTGFTTSTTAQSGAYSLSVTYPGDGCTSSTVVTSPAVTVNALPTVAGISASTSNLCVGAGITFTAGATTGAGTLTSYNWSGPNSFSTTTAANTTGFTAATTAESGAYSVSVTYTGLGCNSATVVTSPEVTVNALPTVASITPSTTEICTGTALSFTAGAATGAGTLSSYNWSGPDGYTAVTAVDNTSFTPASTAASGNYSVTVTYPGTGCTSSAAVTSPAVTVNALPSLTSVSALPASLCEQQVLTLTATGATGTGSLTSYNWSGPAGYAATTTAATQSYTVPATTASGSYSVSVTYQGTGCTSTQVASSAVTVNALPVVYDVNGGGTYCAGGGGLVVGLSGSQTGVDYQLYLDGTATGSPVAGTGSAIDFGAQVPAGTYTVHAVNTATGCGQDMNGSSFVIVSATPTIYAVTGGGTYCENTGGLHVGVSSSNVGVSYQLYRDGTPVGALVVGDGSPVDMGAQIDPGTYTIVGNPGTACERTMTGSAVIIMHPAPNVYDVSGGGTICNGDAGVHINLSWSVLGINYQLYNGSTAYGAPVAGTSSALDLGLANAAGTYTVLATNATTGCMSDMTGSATVIVNPLPAAYTVTGGGTGCSGAGTVLVGLDNSDVNMSYQLYNGATATGSALAGTGAAVSFGSQNVTGVYSVIATNTITGCVGPMNSSVVVSINPAPVPYTVVGGGAYCQGEAGLTVGMAATNVGVLYQLYNGAATVGSAIAGTGAAISFGTQTASGTYSVLGTNMLTSCSGSMSGSVDIVINPQPTVYNVSGGGHYCSGDGGMPVTLSFSSSAISYQLYRGSVAVGAAVTGTGAALDFGNQTIAGTYSVMATNTGTGCTADMSGTATVVENPLPVAYSVTGGGSYCAGGTGVAVGLSNSQSGVNYQLYNGAAAIGTLVAGNGSAISFGMQGAAGTYTVRATNAVSTCSSVMNSSATVVVNTLPTQYVVSGGGHYCAGGTGVEVTLIGSEPGVTYQLYNGATAVGTALSGTGTDISFGMVTAIGSYSVQATNITTSCSSNMFGSVAVYADPLPDAFAVTGGGNYCAGGSGVAVGMASSATGISYQLYNGAAPVGSAVAGTGLAITFGSQTATGTYTVLATNSVTGCTNAMAGNAVVGTNPLPVQYNVTGGGTYCEGGAGVAVGLAGSNTGISYQLYNGATAMGSPVAGTGSALDFGNQIPGGSYTVMATNTTTSCARAMTSSAVIVVNPAPLTYAVTGGGQYCSGGSGVTVGLAGSQIGITYQLYNGAATAGAPVTGSGTTLNFGTFGAAGTYTVLGTHNGTGCTAAMSGDAAVVINPLPVAYNMTGGGGYCVGGTGVAMGVASSQTGVNYQLYRGVDVVGSPVAGTGAAISFGLQTVGGVYSVLATDATTTCTNAMSTTASVVINSLPVVYNVTGGGNYCAGSAGAHVGLESSEPGVNYQLYLGSDAVGSPMPGSGAGLDFGEMYTIGTYSVAAANAITGCASQMSGTASVMVYTPPAAFTVTGGGSYCADGAGVAVGLSGSQSGVNYTLYAGTSVAGTMVAGTGSDISFGSQMAAGTYTVRATGVSSGCEAGMTGTATVAINPLPATFSVTGGGSFCAGGTGVDVGLSGSASGVTYQLYMGSTPVGGTIMGTGSPLSMGLQTGVGSYSAVATNLLTGCVSNMTGAASVSQLPQPTAYTVTGGGSYCNGGSGVAVGLSGSQPGVSYQLYNGSSVAATASGTGSPLNFGLQTSGGSYTVTATNTSTGCTNDMTGTVSVAVNALPTVYLTTGGGNYCAGGSGYAVVLNGSQTGINYELYRDNVPVGTTIAGTGMFLDFGLQSVAGFYTVKANNPATGCVRTMAGSPEIVVHPLPGVYAVTGGGHYCAGGAGVEVALSGSSSAVDYRLYNGSTPVSAFVSGSGSVLSFGAQTTAGTYSVQAVNPATGCTNYMSGAVTVVIDAVPAAYEVTGGGGYCAGGSGVAVGLAGTETDVNYQLYRNGIMSGSAISGTGSSLDFGMMTATGTYSVMAVSGTTSCSSSMTGSVMVSVNPMPVVYSVTGGGSYCQGDAGIQVGLASSQSGVNYTLYNGATAVGTMSGTGSVLTFGPQLAGTYHAKATDAVTGCESNMTGSVSVLENPLPAVYAVAGGGAVCSGSAGTAVTLSGSEPNVTYALYREGIATGATVAGTGAAVSFGLQNVAGSYTAKATSMLSGCISDMTGSAAVSVNPLPVQFSVTGGGSYCAGGAGAVIGLTGSQAGVQYRLWRNGVATSAVVSGTGGVVSFAPQFIAGSYTAVAVNAATSCTTNMSGTTTVSVNPTPVVHTVSGGGSLCQGGAGVNVVMNTSTPGVSYQLYNGSMTVGTAIAGTGSAINFGGQSTAGTYTVLATNAATSCTSAMSGSATVIVNPLPAVHAVTGGGAYCSGGTGVHVGLAGSQAGVTYRLYKGTAAVGAAITGTGDAVDFGPITVAGTYSVRATNASTSCGAAMDGTATVQINALPLAQTVTGGGAYCQGSAGVAVGLSGSQAGVTYSLYNGSTAVATASGTGDIVMFGVYSTTGTYSVAAVNTTTGCTRSMTGTVPVMVNTLPSVYAVAGGGSYCAGGNGVAVSLSGSQSGVNYNIYRDGAMVSTVAGSGASLALGMFTAAGSYSVAAVNSSTGCTAPMAGAATVVVNPKPIVYTVSSGGAYCSGEEGIEVALNGSEAGVMYQLYKGTAASGAPVAGTGSAISFGSRAAGVYSVIATNAATACTQAMTGAATIVMKALPVTYNVTGGGGYCEGGSGKAVGLSGSQAGVAYTLYNGTVATGTPVIGTGSAISFGNQPVGNYTVMAESFATGCTRAMTGAATVYNFAQPVAFDVAGGGNYCAGGTGVGVMLNGSQSGISYRLYRDGAMVGTPVSGTGSSLTFGMYTAEGAYTVKATDMVTGCAGDMTGSVSVGINALPVAHTVTGGGSYCSGGTGVVVGLSGSDAGISYQLYNGSTASGDAVAGTGSALDFGNRADAGTYRVVATDETTMCTSDMNSTVNVAINPLPAAYVLAAGSGSYCAGGAGVQVTLSNSQSGVSYQLYHDGAATGSAVSGASGNGLNFGMHTATGTYSVMATDLTTGCTAAMTGMPSVAVNPLPAQYTVTGGGSYCADDAGVVVGLSGSQPGISYRLYRGTGVVGAAVSGTGTALDFGTQTGGNYTVRAVNAATGCMSNMTGTASVVVNALPAVASVTGGGQFCADGAGVHVGLAASSADVQYQLYNGADMAGTALNGNGGALDFGLLTSAGTYTVHATNVLTGCAADMTGAATVVVNATPAVQTVSGGGSLCVGAAGVNVVLDGSQAGISYRLYNGTEAVGAWVSGTGSGISFPATTTAGTYSVAAMNAATGCAAAMSGTADVIVNNPPAAFVVTGGGAYCAGGDGLAVGLSASASGVNYTLYRDGSMVSSVSGTGGLINFGLQTLAGSYAVTATDAASGCMRNMTGTVSVSVTPGVTPVVTLTSSADAVCAGTLVTYTTSQTNGGTAPAYQWKVNGDNVAVTTSTYSYIPANGDVVSVEMTSNAVCVTSPVATASRTMVVNAGQTPVVTATLSSGSDTICNGTPVTFSAVAEFGGDAPVFEWIKNGSVSTTGTSFTYTPADGDVIYCRLTSNYECRTTALVSSESTLLHVMSQIAPAVTIVADPGTSIAQGQSLKLTAVATNTYMPTYQWYINGAAIHNATSTVFNYSSYQDGDSVVCRVVNNTPCGEFDVFSSVVVNVSSVGVNTVPSVSFDVRLMPNPTTGHFVITGAVSNTVNGSVNIEVANMLGQIVYRGAADVKGGNINAAVTLDAGLSNGMYLVNLRSGNDARVFHVVLDR